MIRAIAHPTDLSPDGAAAFEHALALAVARRCRLDLLHVSRSGRGNWRDFPQVRQVLQRWGRLEQGARTEDVHARTGVSVGKVQIRDHDAVDGLARFLDDHPVDLIVMRSHGRAGLERLVSGSVSVELAQAASVPTLILGPAARPFVDSRTGNIELGKVLVPVDHDPKPGGAVRYLESLLAGLDIALDFLHVGNRAPELGDGRGRARPVRTQDGPVVETLLEEAAGAGLIAMPSAGRQGLRDALQGSTTERIISGAPCPVLAIPVTTGIEIAAAELPTPQVESRLLPPD